jgi:hypothetical protein
MTPKTSLVCLLVWTSLVGWTGRVTAQALESSLTAQTQANQAAIDSQDKVDRLDDATQRLLGTYREIVQQTDSLRVYAEQLDRMLDSQRQEMTSLEEQLQEIEVTRRDILPLLVRMLERLEQFVALDIPFLPEERRARLTSLRTWLDQSDLTIAEKYRRIMEAYQVEMEYGRTIEAYRGGLRIDDQERTVDFLRVGRLALLYQSLDGQEVGQWNHAARQWEPLPQTYRSAVTRGLLVAQRQATPQLLNLPVPTPEPDKVIP